MNSLFIHPSALNLLSFTNCTLLDVEHSPTEEIFELPRSSKPLQSLLKMICSLVIFNLERFNHQKSWYFSQLKLSYRSKPNYLETTIRCSIPKSLILKHFIEILSSYRKKCPNNQIVKLIVLSRLNSFLLIPDDPFKFPYKVSRFIQNAIASV